MNSLREFLADDAAILGLFRIMAMFWLLFVLPIWLIWRDRK